MNQCKFSKGILLGLIITLFISVSYSVATSSDDLTSSEVSDSKSGETSSGYQDGALYCQMQVALQQNNFTLLSTSFIQLTTSYPQADVMPEAYLRYAESLRFLVHDYHGALNYYQKVADQYPNSPSAPKALQSKIQTALIDVFNSEGFPRFHDADSAINQCLQSYPTTQQAAMCQYLKAYSSALMGNWDDAMTAAKNGINTYSNNTLYNDAVVRCWYTVGYAWEWKSQLNNAIAAFQQTIANFPGDPISAEAQREIARCYYFQGNKIQALIEAQKVISQYPGTWIAAQAQKEVDILQNMVSPQATLNLVKNTHTPTQLSSNKSKDALSNLCGPIALHYVLAYLGIPSDVQELAQLSSHTPEGTSFEGLSKAAQQKGLSTKGIKASFARLKLLPLPLIVQLDHRQIDHFVMLSKVTPEKVMFSDQNGMNQSMSLKEFKYQWTRYALILHPVSQENTQLASSGIHYLSQKEMQEVIGGQYSPPPTPLASPADCPNNNPAGPLTANGHASTGALANGGKGIGGSISNELGINLARGNTYTNFTELSIPVQGGMNVTLTHTYSSRYAWSPYALTTNPFGRQWQINYDMNLFLWSNNTIFYYRDFNGYVPLILAGDGNYYPIEDTSQMAVYADYIKVQPPTSTHPFLLEQRDGQIYAFDTLFSIYTAKLVWISNYNQATIYAYYGNNSGVPSTYARLTAMIDINGRGLFFGYSIPSWDSVYRLTSVQDQAGRMITYAYDSISDGISRITYPDNYYVQYAYDTGPNNTTWALITAISDAYSTTTPLYVYLYDYNISTGIDLYSGMIDTVLHCYNVIDMNGNVVNYEFSDWWGYSAITVMDNADHAINQSGYQFDQFDHIYTHINFADYKTNDFVWDIHLDLTQETTQDGKVLNYWYDSLGNKTTHQDKFGTKFFYYYDTTNWYSYLTCKLDAYGKPTFYSYNTSKRLLLSTTDALGNITQFAYDNYGNLTSATDALGEVTRFFYNSYGLVTLVIKWNNSTTQFFYDIYGNKTTGIDPLGNRTDSYYDIMSRVTTVKDNLGGITQYSYSVNGLLTKVTDANQNSTNYTYDLRNRLNKETNAANNSTQYWYDRFDDVTTRQDAKNQMTYYSYDSMNRLSIRTYGNGTIVHFYYDALGNMTGMNDPYIGMTYWGYDVLSRVTGYSNPWGSMVYAYDNNSRRTGLTDPNGNLYGYNNDAYGRLAVLQNYACNQWTQYAYDSIGRKTLEIYPNGIFTAYSFTSCGCGNQVLNTICYQPTDNFNRSGLGYNWTQAVGNWSIQTNQLYIAATSDQMAVYSVGGSVNNPMVECSLDMHTTNSPFANGYLIFGYSNATNYYYAGTNATGTTFVIGHVTNGLYNTDSKITGPVMGEFIYRLRATVSGSTVTLYRLTSSGWQSQLSYIYGSSVPAGYTGVMSAYAYTSYDDFILNNKTTVIAQYAYNYDPAGNRTNMLDMSTSTTFYYYDTLNRLITEQRVGTGAYTRIYSYDSVGNRLTMINGTTFINYYFNNLNQLTFDGTISYSYDANGNLTAEGGIVVPSWNHENQMISIGSPNYSDVFLYDSLGKRIQRINQQSSATTRFFYDGINVLLERYNTYYGEPSTINAVYTLAPGVIGAIISCRNNGTDYFYHYDPIGNVLFVSDTSGNINTSYVQEGFGNVLATNGSANNNYHIATKKQDPDSGLYYFSVQWYDPQVGRFININKNPWKGLVDNPATLHRYTYVGNNPLRYTDLSGLLFGYDPGNILSPNLSNQLNTLHR